MAIRFDENVSQGFDNTNMPSDADLYRCVHCGLCLRSCPTYVATGVETESPRGRIALMKAVKEGRIGITDRVVSHWDRCLQCRACEAVCPSGVPYGRLMESTRAQVAKSNKESTRLRFIKLLFLRGALPHLTLLHIGAWVMRLYQRCGMQRMLRASRLLKILPGGLTEIEGQLPVIKERVFRPTARVLTAYGTSRMKVGLLSGCVMPILQPSAMDASVKVLTRNLCDVAVPMGQGCCGALNLHSGDVEMARKMARRNIDIFLKARVEKVIVASAGCGSAMKEYSELLSNDPDYREKAQQFSEMTVDITEFLVSLPFRPPKALIPRKVTYQDPCHLAHAQRITSQPRDILRSIPGIELVEMENATACCGAAGIYSFVQPTLSRRILESKMETIAATGADTLATANPGCMLQLETGLRITGIPGLTFHVVELLAEAYLSEETAGL